MSACYIGQHVTIVTNMMLRRSMCYTVKPQRLLFVQCAIMTLYDL